MKRKIVFYTPQEEERMLEVYKTCKNQAEAARMLSKEFKRTIGSIQVKLSMLLRMRDNTRKNKDEQKGISLPKGFTFDIKPIKVVMFTDHVRLYF